MNEKIKVKLSGVPETLLIPLWARAEELKQEYPIVTDDLAADFVSRIDYDFDKFRGGKLSQIGCAIRAKILDFHTKDFISRFPQNTIVNAGCGLDTRYFRVDNGKIKWYELDLPEVINIRKEFVPENKRYRFLSKSVLDYSWIDVVNTNDTPVLIIMEGLLMYFSEKQVIELLCTIRDKLRNAELLIEVTTPFIAKNAKKHHDTLKKTGIGMKWGINDSSVLEKLVPGLKIVQEINYFDVQHKRWGFLSLLAAIPWVRNNMNNRILKIRFE